MRPVRLLVLSTTDEPSPWMIVSAEQGIIERGVARPGDAAPVDDMPTVVLVPGHDVMVRRMIVPGRTDAQARAAARWLLGDALAQPPDRTRICLGPQTDGGRIVAVTATGMMEAWIGCVENLGFKAAVMLPDSLLLEEPGEDDDPNALRLGGRLLVRGPDYAFSGEPELWTEVLEGRSLRFISDADRIEALFERAALRPEINLLSDSGTAGAIAGRWRRLALIAVLLALSPVIHLGLATARDEILARRLEAASLAALRAAYPDVRADASAIEEFRRRSGPAAYPGGVLPAAAALAEAIETTGQVRLESLTLLDGRVSASVSCGAAADLEALIAALRARSVEVAVESTTNEAGRVAADLLLGKRA